jgi:hypothetical protein
MIIDKRLAFRQAPPPLPAPPQWPPGSPLHRLDRAVLDKLRDADLDQLKPLDALNLLAELKKQIS